MPNEAKIIWPTKEISGVVKSEWVGEEEKSNPCALGGVGAEFCL
jgi:hypothetical protein